MSSVPDHPRGHTFLGLVDISTKRAAEGIAECEHALKLDRNLADAHSIIGFGKILIGRAEDTEAHTGEALRLSLRDTLAYIWMNFAAGLEIVLETGERTGQDVGVIGAEAGRQLSGDRARGRLIAGGDPRLEFGPRIGRDLGCEVAHPMRQTALARRAGEAFLDRPDDPRRPVADHEQRIAEAATTRRCVLPLRCAGAGSA